MRSSHWPAIILYSILFLFSFQLLADFTEATYTFGLLGLALPPEMVSLLFLFSPLVLLFLRRGLPGLAVICVGELMLLCRVVEPLLETRGRMLVAGLGVACFLILLPLLITRRVGTIPKDGNSEQGMRSSKRREDTRGFSLGIGLTLGLCLSMLLRALNAGSDLSTHGGFQAVGWILAAVAGVQIFRFRERQAASPSQPPPGDAATGAGQGQPSFWRTAGLALGLMGVLTLLYFSFTGPNLVARWTGANYLLIAFIIGLVMSLFAILLVTAPGMVAALKPGIVFAWNLLFVLSLVLTLLAHQVRFPTEIRAYPLAEPAAPSLHYLPLLFMLFLFPVVLVDLMLFAQALADQRPSSRRLGGAFSLASLFLLLMVLAHIFTTTYAYIPAVGPFFRDKFWLVYLVAGLALALPVLLVRRPLCNLGRVLDELKHRPVFPGLIVLLSAATVAGAFLTAARPEVPLAPPAALRILTYNVQQGYDPEGQRNFEGQLDLLREAGADVVGLQECDTNRIAGGNADLIRHFADRLDMHSYYGPKPVVGTFGIALLSRFPIENPRIFYMYSYERQDDELVDLEQTATIEAQITVAGKTFNVLVTHLGNGGPMVQQEAVLQEVEGKENVILMGDFNFDPDSAQYNLTSTVLDDAWQLRWPSVDKRTRSFTGSGINHIFVSPGTRVTDAQYLPDPESDHPATTADIEW